MDEREPETREELVQHLERMPPRLAVNVSPAQLRRGDFVDLVKDALAPVERATDAIDIEITESMLMEISRAASTSRMAIVSTVIRSRARSTEGLAQEVETEEQANLRAAVDFNEGESVRRWR